MKPYPDYKPTGLAWLPEIPKRWKLVRGKNLFKKANRPVEEGSEIITCFRDGEVTLRKNRRATGFTESLKEIGYQGIKKGDLVIHVMDAFAGAIGVSDSDGKGTPVYNVCIARTPDTTNNYYFAYIVRVMAQTGYIQSLYRGIRERSSDFRFEVFANQPLPFPPADEQAQIVRYLDAMTAKINKLIRAKKRQIALLQEQKQAIINQAVTRGLDPDVELKDSGIDWLGPIPKQWEIKTVKQYFKIRKQIAGHEGYDVLSITQDGIKIKDISTNEGQMAMSYAGYQLVRPGDFAMNHMDLLTGYVDRSNYVGVTSPDYRVFELCDNANCHPDFFLYVFQLYYKRRIFYRYGRGAASVGRWRLPAREFLNFVIPVPPIISQKRIVRFVKNNTQNIDKNILAVESQIKILSEYKNSLIAAVVTGKVDVRNIAVEAVPPEDLAPSDDPDESEEQDSPVSEESEE